VQLFKLAQEWDNAPGDYDLCVSVVAAEDDYLENVIGIASRDDLMTTFFGGRNSSPPLNILVIFFQYSNIDNKPDTYDPSWCSKIKTILNPRSTGRPGGNE